MNENSRLNPVLVTSRVDSHEVLDWTDIDIRTEEERSWPVVEATSRVDSMTFIETGSVPLLVLMLTPVRPIAEMDRTVLAGDVKLFRYALDEYDRSLGGNGLALTRTDSAADSITLTLTPLVVENADERLGKIVRVLEAEQNGSLTAIDLAGDESPTSGLALVRPRFGRVHAEINHPSKA